MKVAINACFGGFGLSHKGTTRYAELMGMDIEAYTHDYKTKTDVPYGGDGEDPMFLHYKADGEYFSDRNIKRDDPILIQVIEELEDEASGFCARLRIVEVPDGADWEVDEYDGSEHIAEKHRTWR